MSTISYLYESKNVTEISRAKETACIIKLQSLVMFHAIILLRICLEVGQINFFASHIMGCNKIFNEILIGLFLISVFLFTLFIYVIFYALIIIH